MARESFFFAISPIKLLLLGLATTAMTAGPVVVAGFGSPQTDIDSIAGSTEGSPIRHDGVDPPRPPIRPDGDSPSRPSVLPGSVKVKPHRPPVGRGVAARPSDDIVKNTNALPIHHDNDCVFPKQVGNANAPNIKGKDASPTFQDVNGISGDDAASSPEDTDATIVEDSVAPPTKTSGGVRSSPRKLVISSPAVP